MKKTLLLTPMALYHYADGQRIYGNCSGLSGDCSRLYGDCSGLSGDCSGLYGDCSRLSGDCSGLYGDCSGLYGYCSRLSGDCSGLYGNCSGLSGDFDDCEISDEEREHGVSLRELIAADKAANSDLETLADDDRVEPVAEEEAK